MFRPDPTGKKFGPLWFAPGISGLNVITLLYAAWSTLGALTYMNFIQPYILVEILNVSEEDIGPLTGNLAALQEVIVILLAGWAGAYSDDVGRRRMFVAGFILLGAGYFIYPLTDDVFQLYIFRAIFAVGAAITPIMLSACIVDYIQEVSRGRWIGLGSIFNGLGVFFMAGVLSQSPQWFQDLGAAPDDAGRYALWVVTAFCLLSAVVLQLGLKGKEIDRNRERISIMRQIADGITAGRNPRLALAYAAAFIGRGDLVVVGTFFSLWVVSAGAKIGMPTGQAQGQAGLLFLIIQGSAMAWAFFMGMIADRVNRVSALVLALSMAAIGYSLIGLSDNPFGWAMIPIYVFLGMGETSVVIAGGAVLGQEARTRPKISGSVVGVYGLLGGVGIFFATAVGGQINTPEWRTAPFAMMGVLNALLAAVAVYVRVYHGTPPAGPDDAPAVQPEVVGGVIGQDAQGPQGPPGSVRPGGRP